jgi:large subunit ribosomal protein L4
MSTAATTKPAAAKLPADIFNVEIKSHDLMKLAYNAYLAEGRSAHARTKTRGLISGGGRKPHAQKGTGRARSGSTRNPIWRGGGITFGPTGNENYSLTLSTKMRRVAVRQALSLANKDKQITVVKDFGVKDGKTKEVIAFLQSQKADRGGLLVTGKKTPELIRATNNIPGVNLVSASYLATYHVLTAHHIFIDESGLATLTERLAVQGAAK